MTNFYVPPQDKPLYGRTTGGRYEYDKRFGMWFGADDAYDLEDVYAREPDGLTDVRPFKVGDTVSSAEDLDALPDETILRDESGAWMKDRGWFLLMWTRVLYPSSELAYDNMLTIVWLPEGKGEQA